jgi:hypothetical protein
MEDVKTKDQIKPHQQLFASVVLAALDDAITDEQARGNGADIISRWAKSRDGQIVLTCAGIEPSQRCIDKLREFVMQGIKTSSALARTNTLMAAA